MKNIHYIFFVLNLGLFLALFTCRTHPGEKKFQSSEKKEEEMVNVITLGPQDSGKGFKIAVGDAFKVILPENPTTGYEWMVYKSGSPFITLEAEKYSPPPEEKIIVGRGGKKTIVFRAIKSGSTELVLRLRRSWEEESKFVQSFQVQLEIVD